MKSAGMKRRKASNGRRASPIHASPNTRDVGLADPHLRHSPSSGFDQSEAESFRYERSMNPNVHYVPGENNRDELREWAPKRGLGSGRMPRFRDDHEIDDFVYEVLSKHPDIDVSQLDFEVHQGVVTLHGLVETRRLKRLVEDVVYGLPGVHDVINQIQVQRHDPDRRRIARSLT